MSSLRVYNAESNRNKEKTLNETVLPFIYFKQYFEKHFPKVDDFSLTSDEKEFLFSNGSIIQITNIQNVM